MIGIAIKLFAWATASASRILLALLLAALAWGYWGHRSAAKWQRVAQSTFAAQKAASEAQIAVNHAPAVQSAAIARKSNDEAPAYYDIARRAAAANAVRLRPAACPPGAADLPGTDTAIESVHGPDIAPALVCRSFVEDNQIVGAAARAAEMHQEALDLIDAGLAIAGD